MSFFVKVLLALILMCLVHGYMPMPMPIQDMPPHYDSLFRTVQVSEGSKLKINKTSTVEH